jgi:hypothetical protein
VLSTGCGKRKLRRAGLSELLNRSLVEARVDRLEDPIEDFFIEAIPTRHGDYLIFSGIWEKAAAHTECVLQAFTALPEWAAKDQALLTTYSLLALSDALARRCGLGRRAIGENSRANGITVPSEERLQLLSQRVRFTWSALSKLGIKRETLLPFGLSMEAATSLADSVQGDSALEFQPLILTEDGLLVAAPANISTAARAWMIDVAIKGGQERRTSEQVAGGASRACERERLCPARGYGACPGNTWFDAAKPLRRIGRALYSYHPNDCRFCRLASLRVR